MKPIEFELLKLLINQNNLTAKKLSEKLKVSPRSIKNYVHNINQESPSTIISSHKGYQIDIKKATTFLSTPSPNIPQTAKERVAYIANKLINHSKSQTLNIYDLAEEIYVSEATLKKDLSRLKAMFHQHDLKLIIKGDIIKVQGLEKQKRKMLSTIIYQESSVNFVNLQTIQNIFPNINIKLIRKIILFNLEKAHYFINDYSLINLILHITITIDRIQHHNSNCICMQNLPDIMAHEYQLAQNISKQLENKFQIQFNEHEVYEMTLLIISKATPIDYNHLKSTDLNRIIGIECMSLVNEILTHIYDYYDINLTENEFIIKFALHIKNLLIRSQNNYFSKNPLSQEIKTSCPLIYDMAVYSAKLIREKTNIIINDDEIAYIAFHLGSSLEQQKSLNTKVLAILYCPNYYNMSLKITKTINSFFTNDILITTVISDESNLKHLNGIDLIITTLPIERTLVIPTIQIQFYFSKDDQKKLSLKIFEIKQKKRQNQFENHLRTLLIPDFFEINNNLQTSDNTIHYMTKKFIKYGYVEKSFEKEIHEREKLSSTAFNGFAIPHSMKMNAFKTGLNIIISPNGINWNSKIIYIVLMMCFNENERYIFNEIYEPISMILSENENILKLSLTKNYDEFITLISSLVQ